MFTIENLSIALVVLLILLNGYTILQFITYLYYKFRYTDFRVVQKDTIDSDTLEIIKPLEEFLLSEGFIYKNILVHDSPIVGNTQKYYIAYYFNPTTYVHAHIKTQPYRGALEPVKITYDSFYEDGSIVTTINAESFFIPSVPKGIELFDHNLTDIYSVYSMHLKDRAHKMETLDQKSFTDTTLIDYKTDEDHKYIDSWRKRGVIKLTDYGFKFIPGLETWRFSRDAMRGYRSSAKAMRNQTVEEMRSDTQSQSRAIVKQLEDMEKPRGDSNKILWLLISLVGFVALFSIIGLSIVDIFIVVVVLLIHELGHLLAMRYFGYSDTSIFFLPFGAAAVGKKESRKAFEEYIIFLAGPLPGILIAIGIIAWNLIFNQTLMFQNEYLQFYIFISLIINYINLLPIYPLDGGRIIQTLLLLRYPKGQFYFYLISLGILITAMFWMQDFILLIFVVIIALGLKLNYRISQLLSKLLGNYKQDEITKDVVSTLLAQDETYGKETLAAKANIAKQALTVIQTSKPSKLLLCLGLSFYLLLCLPPLAIYGSGYFRDSSEYSKLPAKAQDELSTFYAKVASLKELTKSGDEPYSIEESIKTLEQYINNKDINRTIGEPLKNAIENNSSKCRPPDGLQKLYRWHNGITNLMPHRDLYSLDEQKSNHQKQLEDEREYDANFTTDYRIFISQYGYNGLAYNCKKDGIYQYSIYSSWNNKKVFYGLNHMLKIVAEAYKRGVYSLDYGTLERDDAGFSSLNREYYSSIDKQRYDELIAYLQNRALEYSDSPHSYIKRELLGEVAKTHDSRMIESIKIYTNDEDRKVRRRAVSALGELGDRSVIPFLLTHLDDDPMHCHGCALAGLSFLVDDRDADILHRVHQSTTHTKTWIRKNAYRVIAQIANIKSLPLLKRVFRDEKPACKIVIVEAFGRIGNKDAIPLLEEYLSEIDEMDFSVDYGDKSLDGGPHPDILKKEVEKAIKTIKQKDS